MVGIFLVQTRVKKTSTRLMDCVYKTGLLVCALGMSWIEAALLTRETRDGSTVFI